VAVAGDCQDNTSWRDSKKGVSCGSWSGYDCSVAFSGYDAPSVVMENCRETCGLCGASAKLTSTGSDSASGEGDVSGKGAVSGKGDDSGIIWGDTSGKGDASGKGMIEIQTNSRAAHCLGVDTSSTTCVLEPARCGSESFTAEVHCDGATQTFQVESNTRLAIDGCETPCTVSGDIPKAKACSDEDRECLAWKAVGFCQADKFPQYLWFMRTTCAQSCGYCQTTSGYVAPPKPCADQWNECATWATYCTDTTWGEWTKQSCPVTCGTCEATGAMQLAALIK